MARMITGCDPEKRSDEAADGGVAQGAEAPAPKR